LGEKIYLRGMSGLGDNLHQRAIVRRMLARGDDIWLETPWPIVYADMPQIRCIRRTERLRTQAKNAAREEGAFWRGNVPPHIRRRQITYSPETVRANGGVVLTAMAQSVAILDGPLDFRLPVPPEWRSIAAAMVRTVARGRPIMVYRPLMDRREWGGCKARNPEIADYRALFGAIRDRYCVVSLADLEEGHEWIVGDMPEVDIAFHQGELSFEIMAGLFSVANLIFTSPGFAVVLGQAVETRVACIFGGYETNRSFMAGAGFTPTLAIGKGCGCFRHDHRCDKTLDVRESVAKLKAFIA